MTDLEVLEQARDLLSNKARWTQDYFARDEGDCVVSTTSRAAVCWCAFGAVEKVTGQCEPTSFGPNAFLCSAASELFPISEGNPAIVNDRLGYEATMQMFDRAIELAAS